MNKKDYIEYLLRVLSFFIAMKDAFKAELPKRVHILLAGNSTKSPLVQDIFTLMTAAKLAKNIDSRISEAELQLTTLEQIFPEDKPQFVIHKPAITKDYHDQFSVKTGVALGILRLAPGSGVITINHSISIDNSEAPFPYYVGRIRRKKFQTILEPNTPYLQWQEIGIVPQDGVFSFYFTQSNIAVNQNIVSVSENLYRRLVHFPAYYHGQKVYVMAATPTSIKISCSDASIEDLTEKNLNIVEEVSLLLDRS